MKNKKPIFIFLSLLVLLVVGLSTVSASDDMAGNSTDISAGTNSHAADSGNADGSNVVEDNYIKENAADKTVKKEKTITNNKTSSNKQLKSYNCSKPSSDGCNEDAVGTNNNIKEADEVQQAKSHDDVVGIKDNVSSINKTLKTSSSISTYLYVDVLKTSTLNTTFKVKVETYSGSNVYSGYVKITDAATNKQTKSKISYGVVYFTLYPDGGNNKKFTIQYLGYGVYKPSNTVTKVLNISKEDTKLSIKAIERKTTKTVLNITAKDSYGRNVKYGQVQVLNNNELVTTGNLSNGSTTVSMNFTKGLKNLTIKYLTNDIYKPVDKSVLVNIKAADTNINVSVTKSNIVNTTFKVAVKSENGNVVSSGRVNVYNALGNKLGYGVVKNGVAYVTIVPAAKGYYTYTLKYTGDNNMYGSSANVARTVNVVNAGTNIQAAVLKATTTNTTFKVTVKSGNTHLVRSGIVNVYNSYGNKVGNGSLRKGVANVTITSCDSGYQKFTLKYMGNDYYNPSASLTKNVTVIKVNTTIYVEVKKTNLVNTSFRVTVKSGQKHLVQSGCVDVYDENSKLAGYGYLDNGVATVTITPESKGYHTYFIKYRGNSVYNPSNGVTKKVKVTNAGTNIKADTVKSNIINTTFKVTVKSGETHLVQSGHVNVYDVYGDKVAYGFLNNGVAYISFVPDSKGTYQYRFKYVGNDVYNPSASITKTVKVTNANTNITVETKKATIINTTFKVSVKTDGVPVKSGHVNVYDVYGDKVAYGFLNNGVTYISFVPDSKGTYQYNLKYMGNNVYNPSANVTKTVKVTNANTTIAVEVKKSTASNITFKVTVKTTDNQLVKSGHVNVYDDDGDKVGYGFLNNGATTITILPMDIGYQEFTLKYVGNNVYNPSASITKSLTIISKTIYVRTWGDDDYGTGSSSNPYQSLAKAIKKAGNGYKIDVYGTFNELNPDDTSITINKNITINGGIFSDIKGEYKFITIKKGCTVNMTDMTFEDTISSELLHNEGTLNLVDCTFIDNSMYYDSDLSVTTNAIIKNQGTLTIKYSRFIDDNAGVDKGVIYNTANHKLTIISCYFDSNRSLRHAGVIYNQGTMIVKKSTFSNNKAKYSGGAIVNRGTLTIETTSFRNNKVTSTSSKKQTFGGAIANFGKLTVTKSTFKNNSAVRYGGAIYNAGTVSVTSTNFTSNGGYGSCIYVDSVSAKQYQIYYLGENPTSYYSSKVTVTNCRIVDCYSAFYQAYLTSTDSRVKIEYNYFDRSNMMTWMFHGLSLPKHYSYL